MQLVDLCSVSELREQVLSAERLVLLDARRMEEYEAGHIPGAVRCGWEDWCESAPTDAKASLHEPGYWGKLLDPRDSVVRSNIDALGINVGSHIVVYADAARSKGREGRIAWMLLYFGATRVSILNGGWRTWQKTFPDLSEKGASLSCDLLESSTSSKPSRAAQTVSYAVPREFVINPISLRRCTIDGVRELVLENNGADSILIDTRSGTEFAGIKYDYQPRLGRIPGAISFPYRHLVKLSGEFISREEYLKLLTKFGESVFTRRPIWYCEVGVRAAMAALLHEIYTGEITPVFDGSFMQWAHDPNLPVAIG